MRIPYIGADPHEADDTSTGLSGTPEDVLESLGVDA